MADKKQVLLDDQQRPQRFKSVYHDVGDGVNFSQQVHVDNLPGANKTIINGVAGVPFASADQSGAAAAVSDAPGASKKLYLVGLTISAGATAQLMTFTEETSGTVVGKFNVPANTTLHFDFANPLHTAVANKKLMVQTGASGVISVLAQYYVE